MKPQEMTLSPEIRPPTPGEFSRISGLVPRRARTLALRVAVLGRVERIAVAAALYQREDEASEGVAYLQFTAAAGSQEVTILRVLQSLVEEAKAIGAIDAVMVLSSVETTQPLFQILVKAGFEPCRHLDIYRMEIRVLQPRIEALYQRLATRGLIPPEARITSPHGDWIPKLRGFLESEKRGLSGRIETETEGFALEHSLLLVMGDEVKGVLFTRNRGAESFVGLILVAHGLRGGIAWANAFLIREVLLDGIESGVEHVVFEAHSEDHRGTLHIARASGAERISARSQFCAKIDAISASSLTLSRREPIPSD